MQVLALANNVIVEIITIADALAKDVEKRLGLLVQKDKLMTKEPNTGIVHSIGCDVPKDCDYLVGDTVVFRSEGIFQGFEIAGKKLAQANHSDIMAKLEIAK